MSRTVGVVLGGPSGDGGFVDAAVAAVARARAAGVEVDLRATAPDVLDPAWDAVLCHGVQLRGWLVEQRAAGRDVPAVLTDLPADRTGLDGVTLVDWAWDEGARCAGAAAAALAGGGTVGLVAGPVVLTQRRVAAAFADGVARWAEAHSPVELRTVFLRSFDDVAGGARAGAELAAAGCTVVAHTADGAGERACAEARSAGARTIGFVVPGDAHVGVVRSDVSLVVEDLLRELAAGAPEPAVRHCGLASGRLGLELGDVPDDVRRVADEVRADVLRGA